MKLKITDIEDGDILQCWLFGRWVDQWVLTNQFQKAEALHNVNRKPRVHDAQYRIIRTKVIATGKPVPEDGRCKR